MEKTILPSAARSLTIPRSTDVTNSRATSHGSIPPRSSETPRLSQKLPATPETMRLRQPYTIDQSSEHTRLAKSTRGFLGAVTTTAPPPTFLIAPDPPGRACPARQFRRDADIAPKPGTSLGIRIGTAASRRTSPAALKIASCVAPNPAKIFCAACRNQRRIQQKGSGET